MRVAAAPISWGVCEVPGWGHQMAPHRVLAEMAALGLTATEFGPDGFLPAEPGRRAALLAGHGLEPVGGFVPVVLHDPAYDPLPGIERALDSFGAATTLVLAAATGRDGYDERPEPTAEHWATMLANLDRAARLARNRGIVAALHPHVGTVVERREEVERVLGGSHIALCLDTGHLLIGGTDPLELARKAAHRIAHTHLKDVDAALAGRVRSGDMTYTDAVRRGMYRPLGAGDAGIAGIVDALRDAGYGGWYVLEQDTMLAGPGARPAVDVARSLAFLESL